MKIFKIVRRIVCRHKYKTQANHLIGTYMKCEKCGKIVSFEEYVAKLLNKR